MPMQTINIGTAANDGTGDTLRDAFGKCNDNFDELYDDKADKASPTFSGTAGFDAVDVAGEARCNSLRVDQTPTAETVVCTHTITLSVNGTSYKVPCVAA